MTTEEAIALAESGWWKDIPADVVVAFQLFEAKLCMDFGDFHGAVEKALGRPVSTHEFADAERLRQEFLGKRPAATFAEISELIPELIPPDKLVVIVAATAERMNALMRTGHAGDVDAPSILMPPSLLRCHWPPNAGVMPGDSRFDAVLASIRDHGILRPLVISLDWFVIDGNHRLAAARHLGLERVPVRIWTGVEFLPAAPQGDD